MEEARATVRGVVNLWFAQDRDADLLLESSPLALLIGMCLEQQMPLEVAFAGPKKWRTEWLGMPTLNVLT
ncbi:hypothetical protein BKG83_11945 [Mycobacteroides chelonae]|uniref:Uncharacterized protein n=1 Tax=Mycobacteroides chelonae TaxID=1774 RepID=A0A1S1LXX2_MYCCH|nr:hypothetical protein BKG83_11945 [Mycobacteroides chelonae]OHU75770.1 hypothetical protein BKG84_26895 [Mycobacteroides chelonae]SKM16304.1 Base excision DNA repair protein,HhH-GPD family protein [Mycobacteroides abscessus subsp. bolletii]